MSIPRDVQEFLDKYPGRADDLKASANLRFYSNSLRCRPDNKLIDEIHKEWFGDYETLEYNHGFIQWLFPIREYGVNYESQPLQPHEIKSMTSDAVVMERLLKSYRLMLDFYGMRLVSSETGLIDRSLPPRNFSARYRNLVRSSHNNLRISRILKCLSEIGMERLNAGFVLHILSEQSESNLLDSSGIRSSMDRWWANCIRNTEEREWVQDTIKKTRENANGYVFTRERYVNALLARQKTGKLQ